MSDRISWRIRKKTPFLHQKTFFWTKYGSYKKWLLLAKLGFQTWHATNLTFILPPINLLGAVFCSFSLWIFFRSTFSDPIYFYYKLLCFINIIHLLHNIPYGVSIWPLFFPRINSYVTIIFQIYY